MFEILVLLAKSTPVIAVLWMGIRYFLKKEKAYQSQIADLHKELRANERETLTLMNRLTTTLDKVIESGQSDRDEILHEIKTLAKDLNRKINELKK